MQFIEGLKTRFAKTTRKQKLFLLLALFTSLLTIFMSFFFPFDVKEYESLGYFGLAVAVLLNSAAVISFSPIPAFVVAFFAAAYLDHTLLIVISALMATIGEFVDYLFGHGIDNFVSDRKWHKYLKKLFLKSPFIFLVIWIAIPNPIQAVGQIFAGTTKYPWWKFGLATFIGNVIWFILVVEAGQWLFDVGII